jgi:RNA polymerase sigma-70 factor (ECF subfamily)
MRAQAVDAIVRRSGRRRLIDVDVNVNRPVPGPLPATLGGALRCAGPLVGHAHPRGRDVRTAWMDRTPMLDDVEVKRLLIRTAAGDAGAFERLYRTTMPLLLGVVLRIAGRRELAQEIVHDAYLRIWRQASSFDPLAAHAVAWMVAIARNRAIDVVSSAEGSRVDPAGDDIERIVDGGYDWTASAEDALDHGRSARWLRACLDELRPAERQAIVLAYHHGMSHVDLAAHLARPLGTVKAWVRRGLDSLRRCVEESGGGAR